MKQNKTIPFDWKLYNNNRDKYKVVTRDGDEVTQLTKFEGVNNYPLRGCKANYIQSWELNGSYHKHNESDSFDLQLQYEEEVVESWVNLYRTDDGFISTSATFITKEAARSIGICVKGYFKTINLNDLV
jgi:hypothetical protein